MEACDLAKVVLDKGKQHSRGKNDLAYEMLGQKPSEKLGQRKQNILNVTVFRYSPKVTMPSMFATRSLCKLGYPEELDEFLTKAKSSCGEGEDMEWLDVATEDGWTCLHDMITHECQFSKVLCCSLSLTFQSFGPLG